MEVYKFVNKASELVGVEVEQMLEAFMEKALGERIGGAPRSEIGKWIDQSKPKQHVTLAEQKNAKAGLEAFRAYTDEVTR